MRHLLVAMAMLLATGLCAAQGRHAGLHELFAAEWERGLRETPENASGLGDPRYNDRWSDLSLAAIEARLKSDRAALARLHRIGRKSLSAADRLHYDTFEWQLRQSIARSQFREYLTPVGMAGGVQTADGLAQVLPFDSEKDYRDWLARLAALPALVEQNIVLMREGIRTGIMPPAILMTRASKQIARQASGAPADSAFYQPFLKMPDAFSQQKKDELRKEAVRVIGEQVMPAYARLGKFFDGEYLPRARAAIGLSARPDGKAYYDFLAAYYTTTSLSADAIHAIGLAEVARIRARMEEVMRETGFKGTLAEFFTFLRTDPQFFHKSGAELLTAYQAISKRIDPELVKVFSVVPRLPYGVRPIPDNLAPDTTTAYYQLGSADGRRPGFYYVNLFKPETRPTWEMMALSLHEAVPGHHFQFARALELGELPMFRKTAYFVAYSEGWGLYAEQLGYDMGLYENPYDRFGQLTYEMWRAVRLVVDTGMHAKGWSREQAIDYFKANAPKTEQDIVNEIDRYIDTPGQALAYKIGQMKISELRKRASDALGPRFDLRAFNDELVGTGSIPLNALELHIQEWIKRQSARK